MPSLVWLMAVMVAALGTAAAAYLLHLRRVDQWREREKTLLRMMREQELATSQLQIAHLTLEQRAAQLARVNAELERFAHIASHDLKEPVRTVVSYTQLLARKYAGQLDAAAQEYIRDAAAAAISIRGRLEGFLEYAEAGSGAQAGEAADSAAAAARAIGQIKSAIAASGASVQCEALPAVRAHGPELITLFHNLLDNAIKFRGAQPPAIHISAQRGSKAGEWLFCVRDNGIGVDSRHAERIFGLFQRLHHADQYPGMGMGLAVCRKIVEGLGGRIWCEPAEGGGSCFRFTLPAP